MPASQRWWEMIRTFAIAAILTVTPSLASAQTAFATPAPAPAETTDAPEEAPQGSPFEMLPAPPPASRVAYTAPASRTLLERPARPDMPRTFDALQYEAAIKR